MNKPLTALTTKLTWQLNILYEQFQVVQNQIHELEQQLQSLETQIKNAYPVSIIINPELEMNRLNFIVQQGEKKVELTDRLKNKQYEENILKEKIQRIKTELKILENYIEREELSKKKQEKKKQDDLIDEWVIQKDSL